jgi:hypothetical protein
LHWSSADRAASVRQRRSALAEDGADIAISYAASAAKAEAVVLKLEGKGGRENVALCSHNLHRNEAEGRTSVSAATNPDRLERKRA